jgi:endoglucanase
VRWLPLTHASQIDAKFPTYYGAAWVALGRVLLTLDRLGHC